MKRLILFLLALVPNVFLLAQTTPYSYSSIKDALGKTVYITTDLKSDIRHTLASYTYIEKKPGKYKKCKVVTTSYYGLFEGVKELPNFFYGVYYKVIDEIIIEGESYIRFQQDSNGESVFFAIPKRRIEEHIMNGPMLQLDRITAEANRIGQMYSYASLDETTHAFYKIGYAMSASEKKQLVEIKSVDFSKSIDGKKYAKFKMLGYTICDKYETPFLITAKIGNSEGLIQYGILQEMIKDKALLTQRELDSIERVVFVNDSLDEVRDHGVFLGISRGDTVALYCCSGSTFRETFIGYSNGVITSYSKYDVSFIDKKDESYLKRRQEKGIEIRKEAARQYDSIMVQRKEAERIRKEEEARLEEERTIQFIDSTILVCKKKQIFIWKQEYAYGDYGKFGLEWNFFNCYNKVIKYIELTIKPYNQVNDIQRDDFGRKEAKAKCIGPIESGDLATFTFDELFWDDNDLINKLKVSYIKITFMDNTTKVFSGIENVNKHRLAF